MTILVGFALYLVALLVIGVAASRRTKSTEGFYLGDRSQGSWVTAVSSAASSESGWVTLGLVGMGYAQGLSAYWFVVGCLGGFVINWFLVARRLRLLSHKDGSVTLPDFLEARTGRNTTARLVAVLIIFLCMMGYIAAQFTAAGKTFQVVFGFDYRLGVVIGAVITILYTLIGGYRAVSWTDLLQGLLMAGGLVVLPIYLIFFHGDLGGAGGMGDKVSAMPARSVLMVQASTGGVFANKRLGYIEDGTLWISTDSDAGQKKLGFVQGKPGEPQELALGGLPAGRVGLTVHPAADGGPPTTIRVANESPETVTIQSTAATTTAAPGATQDVPFDPLPALSWGEATIEMEVKSSAAGAVCSSLSMGKTGMALLGLVLGALGIGLGYPGQPHVLTRFMAAKDEATIKRARLIALIWGVLALSGAVLLGYLCRVLLPGLNDPEFAYPAAATGFLPDIVAGVLVAAIVAAIMSTADSQLLVAASAMSRDLYQKVLKRDVDVADAKLVWAGRAVVLVLGALAFLTALGEARVVFWFVLLAWSGLGASFGPPVLLSLFWKRINSTGALAGMITGFGVTALWNFVLKQVVADATGLKLYELVPAFFLSLLATVIGSLLSQPKPAAPDPASDPTPDSTPDSSRDAAPDSE